MGFFKKDKPGGKFKGSGSKPFKRHGGGGSFGGSRDAGKQMYKTVCGDCGKTAEVPFKPSGTKPVLCRSCFEPEERSSYGDSKRGGGSFSKSKFASKRPFERGGKGGSRSHGSDSVERSLREISTKLDRVLEELSDLRA